MPRRAGPAGRCSTLAIGQQRGGQVARRVAPVELVGLVGRARGRPAAAARCAAAPATKPRVRGIGPMEVLEREQHDAVAGQPLQGAQDRLLDAAAQLLGRGQARRRPVDAQRVEALGRRRAAARPRSWPDRPMTCAHRGRRRAWRAPTPSAAPSAWYASPAQDSSAAPRATTTPGRPRSRWVSSSSEARDADARGSREHDATVPPVSGTLQRIGEPGELALPPHERHGPRIAPCVRDTAYVTDRPVHDRQHPQRADRGGVALLHEVAVDDGLPVRAGPRGAQGARRQQAAAADGPADRVLHEGR